MYTRAKLFEWDENKNKINIQKHSVSFQEAILIFNGAVLTFEDKRKDYSEKREISIGQIKNVLVVVIVHTKRKDKIRIISARLANKRERILYYEHFKEKN